MGDTASVLSQFEILEHSQVAAKLCIEDGFGRSGRVLEPLVARSASYSASKPKASRISAMLSTRLANSASRRNREPISS